MKWGQWILVNWLRTLRVRFHDPLPSQAVYSLWHQDLPACMAAFRKQGITVLISQSRDGDWASGIAGKLGYQVVRGSSSKGQLGLRQLYRALGRGASVGMALDGPKGPALVAKPGTDWLVRASGVPEFRIAVHYSLALWVRSWDRTFLPLPFSRVTIRLSR